MYIFRVIRKEPLDATSLLTGAFPPTVVVTFQVVKRWARRRKYGIPLLSVIEPDIPARREEYEEAVKGFADQGIKVSLAASWLWPRCKNPSGNLIPEMDFRPAHLIPEDYYAV